MKKYRCIIIGIVLLVCAGALVFYHYFYIGYQPFKDLQADDIENISIVFGGWPEYDAHPDDIEEIISLLRRVRIYNRKYDRTVYYGGNMDLKFILILKNGERLVTGPTNNGGGFWYYLYKGNQYRMEKELYCEMSAILDEYETAILEYNGYYDK